VTVEAADERRVIDGWDKFSTPQQQQQEEALPLVRCWVDSGQWTVDQADRTSSSINLVICRPVSCALLRVASASSRLTRSHPVVVQSISWSIHLHCYIGGGELTCLQAGTLICLYTTVMPVCTRAGAGPTKQLCAYLQPFAHDA